MRHLAILAGSGLALGVLALRISAVRVLAVRVGPLRVLVLGVLVRANWRLPVLAGLAGGVRAACLLRLAVWLLTVRSVVVLWRAIWPWAQAPVRPECRGGLSPGGELPCAVLPSVILPGTVLARAELSLAWGPVLACRGLARPVRSLPGFRVEQSARSTAAG